MNARQAKICAWAHDYLHQAGEWAMLDTETTGLGSSDEVLELALVNPSGSVLFSSLIQPQDPHRPDLATHIHGISAQMLAVAPTFPEVWPTIEALLQRHPQILVYNADFDSRILKATAERYGYQLPNVTWSCLMKNYAVYHGAWHSYHCSYIWQKLQVACDRLGVQVDGTYHRATADTVSTLGVLRALAALHPQAKEDHP